MMTKVPGIVVMTHGKTGKELIASLEMIVGSTENITAVSLLPGQTPEAYLAEVRGILDEQDSNTILLVDLFGGTPSNCAASLSSKYNVEIISGVNLPMLIEAVQLRGIVNGEELRQQLVDAGCNGIKDLIKEMK